MLDLAVSDQGNLAGPNFVKMQTRLVWVFSLEMSILPLLTPWRAVGVDASPFFTQVRARFKSTQRLRAEFWNKQFVLAIAHSFSFSVQAVESEPWVQRADTPSVCCPVTRLARAQSSVLREPNGHCHHTLGVSYTSLLAPVVNRASRSPRIQQSLVRCLPRLRSTINFNALGYGFTKRFSCSVL